MTRIARPAVLCVALSCLSISARAESLESLKTANFLSSWESGLSGARPAPAAPAGRPVGPVPARAAQVLIYERGGFTWQSDASGALEEATRNLRAAGIGVLKAEVFQETTSPWNYGLRIDYLDDQADPAQPPRRLETYTSGYYPWATDAETEMNRAELNLRASGQAVILGRVLRQPESPWNYYYQIDYVKARLNPGREVYVYTSQFYATAPDARRDMVTTERNLMNRGYLIYSAMVYRDGKAGDYFYQIRYGGRPRR